MSREDHKRAAELFEKVCDLPAEQRTAALEEACAGDADLRQQVERLLVADQRADNDAFLAKPALQDAARLISSEPENLPAAGTILGNYQLDGRIGAGGMGIVYEAQDLRLSRRVALKTLIPLHSHKVVGLENDERILRFQREARAASQLNHPHIASIFDASFDRGCHYIAMEFVEGQTLRSLIASESKFINTKTVLEIISQIASALSAAHAAGIVHRDIKPENIMIRPDGFIKVLDFGLATVRETSASGSDLRTRVGNLAGTIQYLSPEQVLGKSATPRSDLFSLGVVAYELATGVRPFDGPTDGAIFDAILHRDPPAPSSVRPSLGTELDELILRLLEKDPELRFQTAGDLRSTCRRLNRDSAPSIVTDSTSKAASAAVPASQVNGFPFRLWAVPFGLILLAAAGFLVWLTQPAPAPRVSDIVPITHDGTLKEFFVNDGTRIYYSDNSNTPEAQMFQVSTSGGSPIPMPVFHGMIPLDISADGAQLLLGQVLGTTGSLRALWIAPAMGGPARRLGDLLAEDARWSPKGDEILYAKPPELRIARTDTLESRLVKRIPSTVNPEWSPDGRFIRFTEETSSSSSLWEVAVDGTNLHQLFSDEANISRRDGTWTLDSKYFLFSSRQVTTDLWALSQPAHLPFGFSRNPTLTRLTNGPLMADKPQPSRTGHRIFFRGKLDRGELVSYDPQSDHWSTYLQSIPAMQVDYSRDGKYITYANYPDGSVWKASSDGTNRVQLTTPSIFARNPRWSPDGTQIIFYGAESGQKDHIYLVPAAGGSVVQLTHGEGGPGGDADGSWSHDGTSIVFGTDYDDQLAHKPLTLLNLKTGQFSKLAGSEGFWSARWSPDGRYVAGMKTPGDMLWICDVATHRQTQLTTIPVSWPSWSRDSQYLYFGNSSAWYRVNIYDRKVARAGTQRDLHGTNVDLGWIGTTPDGTLIATRDTSSVEIYAINWVYK